MVQSLISPALVESLGSVTEAQSVLIDQSVLDRFATGVGLQPSELTPELSKGLFASVLLRGKPAWDRVRGLLPPSVLDGGGEWTFHAPVACGDAITVTSTLSAVDEKVGGRGPMLVVTVDTSWTNALGDQLASCVGRAIFY